MNHIPCAFVNGNPVKYGPTKGYLIEADHRDGVKTLSLKVIREVFYAHPDAPNDALLVVNESYNILSAKEGEREFARLYPAWIAQQSLKEVSEC